MKNKLVKATIILLIIIFPAGVLTANAYQTKDAYGNYVDSESNYQTKDAFGNYVTHKAED